MRAIAWGVRLSSGATAVMQLLALVKIGAIAVIPSRRWHQTEQEDCCRLHGATIIIDADTPSPPPLVAADSLWSWGDRLADDAVQGIYFTSGTSGTPKPVPLTVGNHRASAIAIHQHMGIRADDYWLNCLPLYHIGGQAIMWRSLFWRIPFFCLRFTPEATHLAVREHPITYISLVPTMLWRLQSLIERSPESWQRLRGIVVGGPPWEPNCAAGQNDGICPYAPPMA
ncbi:MAG: AMP-binding protein [Oscillatoriales cyanobacterium SM2_2_1]|nr:AMP-binding protein [Oscillatoriales cyanobacterium SM2_2_1]